MVAMDKDFYRSVWCLAGLPFDALNLLTAIDCIKTAIAEQEPCFLSTPNLNFLITAQSDKKFRDSVINSDLSVADGMPLIWMARLLKIPFPERVAGSDLAETLFTETAESKIRVFFFGGLPGTGEKACEAINNANKGMEAVGSYYPGLGSIKDMSSDEIIEEINQNNIDFLIVALGAKKGQSWIENNRHRLNAPVISHLGAVINFFAGTVKRAPFLVQRSGFEWLWRIIQEPSLWKRYICDGFYFVKLLTADILPYAAWIRFNQPLLNDVRPIEIEIIENDTTVIIKLTGVCSHNTIDPLRPVFEAASLKRKNISINLESVLALDGAFLGLCLILYKKLNKFGYRLWLEQLNEKNLKIIHWNQMHYLLK